MHAYELMTTIDDQGTLHLPNDCRSAFGRQARVILLLDDAPAPDTAVPPPSLARFAGLLKDSPNLRQDPAAIQRQLRDAWR